MRASPLVAFALGLPLLANAAPPPVATFTNYAKYEIVTVSPSGTFLAITRREDRQSMLTVLTPDMKVASQTRFGDLLDIERIEWASDHRLLVQPSRRFPGLTADKVATGEIFGIDVDGKNGEVLFGFAAGRKQSGTHVKRRESTFAPARVLARLPNDPDNVLIQTYGGYNSAYRMNVNTGALEEDLRLASAKWLVRDRFGPSGGVRLRAERCGSRTDVLSPAERWRVEATRD